MKLSRIHIANYRKLRNCNIDFGDEKTIFVGANNSGKTSAMQAIVSFLKDKSRFKTQDFTLVNWNSMNEIFAKWMTDDTLIPSIAEIYEYLPKMDVWLDVDDSEAYLVRDFIPSFDWKGKVVGVRIVYAPQNIEELFSSFKSEYNNSRKFDGEDGIMFSPKNIWDFLSKGSRLSKYFDRRYYVLDPEKESENVEDFQDLPTVEYDNSNNLLSKLIKIDFIEAQREFSDPEASGNEGHNKLSKQLQDYYDKLINPEDSLTEGEVGIMKAVEQAKEQIDEKLKEAFHQRISELQNIGYPGAMNPQIEVHSNVKVKDSLAHDSAVQFALNKDEEALTLPEKYNGLGYQNLISMYFRLIQFRDEWLHEGAISGRGKEQYIEPIHLVFIEEPEAHLHAPAQQVFAKKAYEALTKSSILDSQNYTTQLVLTTHSNHIVHDLDLNNMRYFCRVVDKDCKIPVSHVINLANVFGEDDETRRFVTRYFQYTHCDFFFADAVILVEGAGERILMPRFLEQAELTSSYISVIEINGSHAHRFRNLVERLGIPTLVITDIDAQNKETKRRELTHKGKEQVTNNDTLKKWVPKLTKIDDLLSLPDENKITDNVRVAYQTCIKAKLKAEQRQKTVYPYTFEDSLVLNNLSLFQRENLNTSGMVGKLVRVVQAANDANDCCANLFDAIDNSFVKAQFSIELMFLEDFDSLATPNYIAEGLDWLKEKLNANAE